MRTHFAYVYLIMNPRNNHAYKIMQTKPLQKLRILDLSHTLSGPFATMIMSDFGAEVIKVEPIRGDETRSWSPKVGGESAYFLSLNRGRRSIAIDLTFSEGRDIVYKLSSNSDVVIQNFRPGVAEKLRVDYPTILKFNPEIVYCSIKGFGSNNESASLPAYDLIIQALSGLMATTGEEGLPPVRTSFALFDVITGLIAAFSISACLSGGEKPALVEISMFEAALYAMSYVPLISLLSGTPVRKYGSAHPSIVPYQAFKDADGQFFTVAAANEALWKTMCKSLGLESLITDPRFQTNSERVQHRDELIEILNRVFAEKRRSYWIDLFRQNNVPAAPVLSMADLMGTDYLTEKGVITKVMHKTLGSIPQIMTPVRINHEQVLPSAAPPTIGQDTWDILEELGYDSKEIETLKSKQVIQ
jgi:crotonobetainyl-CoA:carnitine CoA-transferase CaiB-like acyl-CoA transferase